ncbi:MAG TPA: hypothetical protein VNQ79_21410 [Blastocatellia bacterium]|nr:hypothetical protein [Blastocatellia bacterium]
MNPDQIEREAMIQGVTGPDFLCRIFAGGRHWLIIATDWQTGRLLTRLRTKFYTGALVESFALLVCLTRFGPLEIAVAEKRFCPARKLSRLLGQSGALCAAPDGRDVLILGEDDMTWLAARWLAATLRRRP